MTRYNLTVFERKKAVILTCFFLLNLFRFYNIINTIKVIASDKTGTLTQNKMFVTNSAAGLTVVSSNSARRASVSGLKETNLKSSLQLLYTCIICNEAKFDDSPAEKDKPINERTASGGNNNNYHHICTY